MLNKGELLRRGWTPELVASVLGRPDQVKPHQRGLRKWTEHLYLDSRVATGEADARFVEAQSIRRARTEAEAQRRAEIPMRYAGWREALPEAAEVLFSLNRYAKHRACSPLHRVEIYTLKSEMIRLLWERGYCARAWVHRQQLTEQGCRDCGGAGGYCSHCDGSGIWRPAKSREYWCFEFLVGGKVYCWHQPRESVEFAPEEALPPQDWVGIAGEKPVVLPRRKFAWAKELLRWTIDAAGSEEPADVVRLAESAVGAQGALF